MDGLFVITFNPIDVSAADGSETVTYHARMRGFYEDGSETSSGDSFTNRVTLTGTTTPIGATSESGTQAVKDASSATLRSDGPVIDKRILQNTSAPHDCDDTTWSPDPADGNWKDDQSASGDEPFTVGSRVCFQIRVKFSNSSSTRQPVVTDFLPDNLAYEENSFHTILGANTADFTVDHAVINPAFEDGTAAFRPGTGSGANRYVQKGQVFAFGFSAIVQANERSVVDIQGNLAKLRWTDKSGKVMSLRDKVDFRIPPVPPVDIDKRVQEVLPTPTALNDNEPVKHGTRVRYQLDVTNLGTTAAGNSIDINGIEVWDVLPIGFRCADLAPGTLSDLAFATCTDPGSLGHPNFTGTGTLSAIAWRLPPGNVLAPVDDDAANVRTLSYELIVPTNTSVGTSYANTAHVRTYNTPTNLSGISAPHFPTDNVDLDVPAADEDAPAASDDARVTLPKVGLTKSNTTSVIETNNGADQAVPGETVTYTIRATVPARTTVYSGVLTDPMPTNLTFVSASALYSATGASPAADPLPGGVFLNPANGTLTLPTTWENATDDDQVFEVTVTAKGAANYTGAPGARTNTATFASKTTAVSGTNVDPVTASSAVNIVQPSPALSKASSPAAAPTAGQTVTYTLTARNSASRPTLYDTVVVDCVPAGLEVLTVGAGATSAPATGTGVGGNGCALGKTTITWTVGSIAASETKTLTYTAKVDPNSAGAASYTNDARLTGSTLNDGSNTAANERVLTATASKTLVLAGASTAKTIVDSSLTVGEKASYTVSGTFPAGINFFDAALIDALPAGLDAASVDTTTVTCTYTVDSTPCTLPAPGGGSELTSSGQSVGWFLGDLGSDPKVRRVTIAFTATVADNCTSAAPECNTIGRTRDNTVLAKWNLTNKADPTTATGAFDKSSLPSNTVSFTVLEPKTAITKSVDASAPAPGESFTYTVTASNPGGLNVSDAFNVVVKDVVPNGVIVDPSSLTDAGGVLTGETATGGGTITWPAISTLTTSGGGSSKVFTYTAKLAASSTLTASALTNTASVTAYDSLASDGRNYTAGPQATASVTPKFPHVSVAKSVVGSAVSYVGEPQTFTITATSDGDSPAHKIDVSDVLPKNWELGTAQVKVGDDPTVTMPPTSDDAGNPQTVSWDDLAPTGLAPGKTIVITYTATPLPGALTDPGAGSGNPHTNTVAVRAEDRTGATSSGTGNYHGAPATATARIHSADLTVTKTADGTPVAGETFDWKIQVRNNGDDPAVGPIVVTDTVPTGFTNFSLSGSGWTCSANMTTWSCSRPGPLASGGDAPELTATGLIPADLAAGSDIDNTADVEARTYDPDDSNNTDTESVEVTTLADLAIDKKLTGIVTAGENATWTLDVSNLGPSTSRGPITVKDTLPEGSSFVSATGTGWSCDESGGEVTCTRAADLPATGESSAGQITIVAKIAASQTANVVNASAVTATTPEPDTDAAKENNSDTVTSPVTRTADLFLQKSLSGSDPVVAGDEATYVLEVQNNGPSTATDVSIVDELPSYMTYVSGGNADWDCSASGQTVTCDLDGSLGVSPSGGPAVVSAVTITVEVDSAHTGAIVNSATATAEEDPTGSTDDDNNTPSLVSDLEVEKSHTGDATAGDPITYSVTVTNNGPSDTAGPITVEDTVPTGMSYASVSGTGWTCDESAGTVECTHAGGIVDGGTLTFELTFDVAEDAGPATVVNNVAVDGPNTDDKTGNNTDSDSTKIVDDANISVTKTASDASVEAGANATWAVQVTNDGPSTADSISVSDLVPVGLTIISMSGTGWDCDDDAGTCTRPSLATGNAPLITVVTRVGSGVASGSTLENKAEVSTTTPGDDVGDNSDADTITTTTSADLTLSKTHTGTPVAGKPFTYDLTVHNDGPSNAVGPIVISDRLPAGMTYVSASEAWSCVAGAISPTGQDVVCTLVSGGPILPDTDADTLAMVVDIGSDQSGTTLDNTASVESATPDPTDNNDDSDSVTPTDEVDLSVTKSHTGTVEVGEQLSFTVLVHNDGPSEARDVELADTLPTGLTFVSASGDGWTCPDGSTTCTLDDPLASGADAEPLTVIVTVTAQAYPEVTNTATVSTSSNDTDSDNDSADDKVTVPAKVDLSVVKELDGTLRVGEQGVYALTVHNDGPTADPGDISVTDDLPAGLRFVSAQAEGWACGAAGQLVTCTRSGSFEVDAFETIVLTVDVLADAYPSVTNSATVSSPADDADPDNNTSDVDAPVGGSSVLGIDKSLISQKGTKAVWKIEVTNAGPTETTEPIVVVDDLPEGLDFVSAKGAGWDCGHAKRVVTCEYAAALPVGSSASFDLATTITATDGSDITNLATVAGGSPDAGVSDDDDAGVTAPSATDGLLPDTGGPMFWLLLAGLMSVAGGSMLIARRRRPVGRHV